MTTNLEQEFTLARLRRQLPAPAELRRLRLAAGLSQGAIAQHLNKDRSTICRYELGTRTPRGTDLARYLALLEELKREAWE